MASVLVVEDDGPLSQFVVDTLRDEGFEVTCVADPAAARAAVVNEPPDVLLLDLTLADGDASDFIASLPERLRYIPVVLMSGWSEATIRNAAEKLGASQTLRKPFDLNDLIASVGRAANGITAPVDDDAGSD